MYGPYVVGLLVEDRLAELRAEADRVRLARRSTRRRPRRLPGRLAGARMLHIPSRSAGQV
ncbi:MAG TPA: hypothetical protein VK908_16460 [Jiangellales bacterium]|jgi:hypothetical protein|nr:hypothetical protein [Jiangellales bacterium]